MVVRFAGFGGQGIVLSSYILGRSAAADGLNAVQTQSYGSESRGGECRGDVIISDGEIYELEPTVYDVLVVMTQPAYERFVRFLKPGGTLILEKDMVVPDGDKEPDGITRHSISATDIAFKKFGRKIVANMVLMGYMNTLLNLVTDGALEDAVATSVPKGTEELNLNAMREGIRLAKRDMKAKPRRRQGSAARTPAKRQRQKRGPGR